LVIETTVLAAHPWLVWVFSFAFGGCIGSFLNVCIYRMPREQSIVFPASRCPGCEHPIAWHDNIPLVSFFALQGHCRHCHKPIRWRYPVVELVTATSAVIVVSAFGATAGALVYFAFVAALITVSVIDLDFQIIPDEISLGGLALGLVVSVLLPSLHGTDSRWLALGRSVIGVLVGGGVLYLTGMLGDFIFRKESMGGGDIKLLAMAGSILGWKLVVLTFFIAPILALLPGLWVLLFRKSHVIPYGPFLSLGLVVALFFGPAILRLSGMDESFQLLWDYYGWHGMPR